MPAIHVHMLTGRIPEQKKAFIKAIAEVTVDILAVPEDAVRIILTEVAPEHWGIGSRDMAEIRAGMKQVGP
jgi:4-oxalocrotonate tautomerase